MIEVAELPLILGVVPASGLMVKVLVAFTPPISGTTIGKVPSVTLL